jgi:hypothetical protein
MNDEIVEQVRRVREELIERFGGIEGYFKHCQAQERAARAKARPRKKPARTPRKAARAR